VPVVYDEAPPIFPTGFPMTDCALYFGWYAGSVAGPFTRPDFRFVPGAIAVHIHSFSAATLRDPNANWVAPLVTKGAAASLGNVYEPYLQLTANLNIFNDRLLHGFTLAESAYMSQRALSWMSVVVGDPLYRPYAAWLQLDSKREAAPGAENWKMYHDFALKNSDKPAPEFRALARQAASRAGNCPMLEDLGLMEARDGNWAEATSYFQQVRACYTKRDDILRAVLEEANAQAKQGNTKLALTVIRNTLRIVPDAPAAELLRQKEAELSPPAPVPSSSPR
jgi:tetratricopeptide (TPR) repeat protein